MIQKTIFSLFLLASLAFGQLNTFTSTTLASAVSAGATTIRVASATNIVAASIANQTNGSFLYVADPGTGQGELMKVTGVNGTIISVQRGVSGIAGGHVSGAIVLVGRADWYSLYDPAGACTVANTVVQPWINTANGRHWLCSSVTGSWVPGFTNGLPPAPTATVASAAGLITPSGPLFTISGTAAITGFNKPTGFVSGGFCAIPSGTFTTTTANNIALGSTAVVNRQLCWVYNPATDKFVPTY
jgi:hypothetical protein